MSDLEKEFKKTVLEVKAQIKKKVNTINSLLAECKELGELNEVPFDLDIDCRLYTYIPKSLQKKFLKFRGDDEDFDKKDFYNILIKEVSHIPYDLDSSYMTGWMTSSDIC